MKFCPRDKSHIFVFFIVGFFLSLAHLYKLFYMYEFWGAEFTTIIMMNFSRQTALACNYRDGITDSEKLRTRENELKQQ